MFKTLIITFTLVSTGFLIVQTSFLDLGDITDVKAIKDHISPDSLIYLETKDEFPNFFTSIYKPTLNYLSYTFFSFVTNLTDFLPPFILNIIALVFLVLTSKEKRSLLLSILLVPLALNSYLLTINKEFYLIIFFLLYIQNFKLKNYLYYTSIVMIAFTRIYFVPALACIELITLYPRYKKEILILFALTIQSVVSLKLSNHHIVRINSASLTLNELYNSSLSFPFSNIIFLPLRLFTSLIEPLVHATKTKSLYSISNSICSFVFISTVYLIYKTKRTPITLVVPISFIILILSTPFIHFRYILPIIPLTIYIHIELNNEDSIS